MTAPFTCHDAPPRAASSGSSANCVPGIGDVFDDLHHWSQVKPFGDLSRAKPAKIGSILDEFCPADRHRRTN
jgi:hypothetical protein